jgi:hypothetical protein
MYLNNIILTAVVLSFTFLLTMPFQSLAEQIEPPESKRQCIKPDPDPEKLSAEEKEWYTTFQEGTFYVQGWKEITEEILSKIPHEKVKLELHKTLQSLGTRVGCEWSKNNDIRKIDNDTLEQWGDLLKKTAADDPSELPQVITELSQKVAALTN